MLEHYPVIHIRPVNVDRYVNRPMRWWYRPARRLPIVGSLAQQLYSSSRNRFVRGGSWDRFTSPWEQHAIHRVFADLLLSWDDYQVTPYYRLIVTVLKRKGMFVHKSHVLRSMEDVDAFFETYLKGLVESMRRAGYREELADQVPGGMIDRHGNVIKTSNGRHRFAVARLILPEEPFPLRLHHVHRKWAQRVTSSAPFDVASLKRALQGIEARLG